MTYPRIEQYNEAIQNYRSFIFDSELKNASLARGGLGLPLVISGGFALTYTFETKNNKYAVRCFHKESKDLELRYNEISKKIKELRSDYFVNFEFQQEGILVAGSKYPLVKMEWAQGETLGEFLETNYNNKEKLSRLLNSIIKLAGFIESNEIAHGDIQPGNLMVSDNGNTIKLIDYDGMYIDELRHLDSTELGHINFQHPKRKDNNPYNSKLDRFSFITLWVSITALVHDPKIWTKTKSDMDSFVFTANDFHDPSNSNVFKLLSGIQALSKYVDFFADVCSGTMSDIPSLETFRALKTSRIRIKRGSGKITTSSLAGAGYFSQYPVLDALNYNECFKHVGDQVEVVGQITDVVEGTTRYGKPYIFINFGDWKGKIFKISIWSNSLDKLDEVPNSNWVGKYISVKGLMEPPYTNKRFKYTHLNITVSKNNQMNVISSSDAKRRLESKQFINNKPTTTNNLTILDEIKKDKPKNKIPPAKSKSNSVRSNNQDILNKIKKTKPTSTTTVPINVTPTTPRPTTTSTASRPTTESSPTTTSTASSPTIISTTSRPTTPSSTTPSSTTASKSTTTTTPRPTTTTASRSTSQNKQLQSKQSVTKSNNDEWIKVFFWIVVIIIVLKACS